MNIIEKNIRDLIPYANNPRNNDKAVEAVAASIKEFGWKNPIVIDKNNVIVAGHTRHLAAQKLGIEKVPCIIADDLTEEQVKAFRLADLVITDPPYNVDYVGKTKDALKIQNDKMSSDNFLAFLTDAFANMRDALREGGAFYIWHAATETPNFWKACENAELQVRQQLIWVKNVFVMGRQDYQWKHEPVLYGWKDGAAHYFINDRTQDTIAMDDTIDFEKLKKEEAIDLLKKIFEDQEPSSVIYENRPSRAELHPTMKPVNLFAKLMKNSSKPGEKVLDLFGGSGTAIMAAEQLDRQAYVMEYDPHYADVIIRRWEEFTGQKAELCTE